MNDKKHFMLYIKDHGEGVGDYQDEVDAISKLQATRYFLKRINTYHFDGEDFISADWGEKEIYNMVEEIYG